MTPHGNISASLLRTWRIDPVCRGNLDCLGCWQLRYNRLPRPRSLQRSLQPPTGAPPSATSLPAGVASAALARPCCIGTAGDGAGRALLAGEPIPEHAFQLTTFHACSHLSAPTSYGTRPTAAVRLDCFGMYVGGALLTIAEHNARCEANPLAGSHAMTVHGYVICAREDQSPSSTKAVESTSSSTRSCSP